MFVKFWHYKIHKKFACVYMQYTTIKQPAILRTVKYFKYCILKALALLEAK